MSSASEKWGQKSVAFIILFTIYIYIYTFLFTYLKKKKFTTKKNIYIARKSCNYPFLFLLILWRKWATIIYSQTEKQSAHAFHKCKRVKNSGTDVCDPENGFGTLPHENVNLTFLISRWLNNEKRAEAACKECVNLSFKDSLSITPPLKWKTGLESCFCQSSCVYSLFTCSQKGAPKPVSMETAKSQSGVPEVYHMTQSLLREALKLAVKLSAFY